MYALAADVCGDLGIDAGQWTDPRLDGWDSIDLPVCVHLQSSFRLSFSVIPAKVRFPSGIMSFTVGTDC